LTWKSKRLRWRECEGLADVFELLEDGRDDRAFAQQESIGGVEQHVAHGVAQPGNQTQAVGDEELFGQRMRDVAAGERRRTEELEHR
jgi:hypothetical protein